MKSTTKNMFRKAGITISVLGLCCCLTLTATLPTWKNDGVASADGAEKKGITQLDASQIDNHIEDYFSASTTQSLSSTVSDDEEISVIVQVDRDSVLDRYQADKKLQSKYTVAQYALTEEGAAVSANISRESRKLQASLSQAGVQYRLGNSYSVLFGGFEIITRAKYFDKVCDTLDGKATVIIGEEYAKCDTVDSSGIVTNTVNVYDTGIFDSSDSKYNGSGVVISVLDTGLDYTHSAFDVSRFEGEEVFTTQSLSEKVGMLRAAETTADLTAADVYVNRKVPYAYDYADGDSDVFPINSEHGTHVSGIIVGNDDAIMGVAPNAQLAFMKVFSDKEDGAKTSWILAALEDCVTLGVDIINMSLGTSAGFSREVDKVNVQNIYDKMEEQGICLVAAAGNEYSSTYGSEKNGNLGLTSNPDNGSVGSPSSYDAALSVASISGVETPYLKSSVTGDAPIYIVEAVGVGAKIKKFVDDTLANAGAAATGTAELEYQLVPGVGRSSDYGTIDVSGKIALVRRGSTNFEDKALIAKQKGAVACIIYNNVSGDISMSVGRVGDYPVCSISKDDGEALAGAEHGTITVSKANTAGPFMSDFSCWGPGAGLTIKPEITAHGGDIYSAVPGQSYDRLSGTSMASPNQAGVTALVRQYVQEELADETMTEAEVTALVYQVMMSTTDIVYNKAGRAYAIRKQGSGLANLTKATTTPAYLRTYDKDGELMNKAKLELGDDKDKTGVYTMSFDLVNVKSGSLTYDVGAIVETEGVSETLTNKGLSTISETGYNLDGAKLDISVSGGTLSGTKVSVNGNSTAKVTVKIILGDEDKAYLDKSFANGMYIEGFVTLKASDGTTVDLNVPYLAFYGDWTQAPIFDLDYFETNKDELDDALDLLDKTLPDAYATRPVGSLYNDYIVYLGSYAFTQAPGATKIAADRKHIALSNQATGENDSTVNSIYMIYAGLLRAAKRLDLSVTNSVTGEVIFTKTIYNQRKSTSGGNTIYPAGVNVGFNMSDYDLKNNSQYIFTAKGYVDYGDDGGSETNLKNTFEFPFVVDFQSPVLTNAEFRTEYDKDAKRYRVYADLSVYDNHYAQGAIIGCINENTDPESEFRYDLESFSRYVTAVYSEFNSTTTVTYELTDYLDKVRNSYNGNSFIVQLYDYAQNTATYEVQVPDYITGIKFVQNDAEITECKLQVNETLSLADIVEISPSGAWVGTLNYSSSNDKIARVVNGKLLGVSEGTASITATSNADKNITATLQVNVYKPEHGGYSKPVTDSFTLTGYTVERVYYFMDSDSRDLGATEAGDTILFTNNQYSLKMFPSESVTIEYDKSKFYFPEETTVQFISNNPNIATVDENGTIVAQAEGSTSVTIRVLQNGNQTLYSQTVYITVKNPYTVNSIYLMSYMGLGGEVVIPDDLGVTEIQQYAFSNYQYIPKDENDEISEEDPYYSKITYWGDDTITKVVIPEGVETIGRYAFAALTALEEVVLPSTLTKIQYGAFYGCTALKKVTFSGANNLQFVNNEAFYDCTALNSVSLNSIVAIGDRAFANTKLMWVSLPETAQSIGAQAFYNCGSLIQLGIKADKVKLGSEAFADCKSLKEITINASVISAGAFDGCTKLAAVNLGKDVSVFGQSAFAGTQVASFTIDKNNPNFKTTGSGLKTVVTTDGTLVLVAPTVTMFSDASVTKIGDGVFAGNESLMSVSLPNVTEVGNAIFRGCTALKSVTLGALTQVGDYAFCDTLIGEVPTLSPSLKAIGNYAFFNTAIKTVTIADGVRVGDYAFASNVALATVKIGNDVVLGDHSFAAYSQEDSLDMGAPNENHYYAVGLAYASSLTSLTIGNNVVIGNAAFQGDCRLKTVTVGAGAAIGDYAFYDCFTLEEIDLSKATEIGAYAFSGSRMVIKYTSDGGKTWGTGLNGCVYFDEYIDEFLQDEGMRGIDTIQKTILTSIDLSSCKEIGEGAFEYCPLGEVVLGDRVTSIGSRAFYRNEDLASLDLGGVREIGSEAFCRTLKLTEVDVSGVESFGTGALRESAVTSLKFKTDAKIGNYAFYKTPLTAVENLGGVSSVGANAFARTLLTEANLSGAEYIGDFAFAETKVENVTLGDGLTAIGENPFAGCALPAFAKNGESTYDIGENVKVIDGVLYRIAQSGGLELVIYPALKQGGVYQVAENTVRIGASAFRCSKLTSVELGRGVVSIGDKAFYDCANLSLIVFKGLNAPILEEQYDTEYQLYTNMPHKGYYGHAEEIYDESEFGSREEYEEFLNSNFKGLAVTPYYMWSQSNTVYYYGANFVGYIGHEELKTHALIMLRPNNGTHYNSFIYSQYFDSVQDGMTAPTDATLSVIGLIKALPTTVSLNDEAAIVAARNALNALPIDQQALVYIGVDDNVNYYALLTSAENQLEFLKGGGDVKPPVIVEPTDDDKNVTGLYVAIGILAGVIVVLIAAMVIVKVVGQKKAKAEPEEDDEPAVSRAENDEQTDDKAADEDSSNE